MFSPKATALKALLSLAMKSPFMRFFHVGGEQDKQVRIWQHCVMFATDEAI